MSSKSLLLVVLLAASFVFPAVARSQNATIGVYGSNDSPACNIPAGFFAAVVKLRATAGPVHTAHFKLVPSCPGASVNQLDFDLTFAPCITEGATMAVVYGTAPVCGGFGFYFDVRGPNGEYTIPMTDCDGYAMTGVDAVQIIDYSPCDMDSRLIAPYRPTPADGATDVPLNTMLSYVGPANTIEMSTQPLEQYATGPLVCGFGYCFPSSPNLPLCGYPVNPGPLAPKTKYYWRATTQAPTHWWCISASSQVFTFTTADVPLATAVSTWGHVKAMYRN